MLIHLGGLLHGLLPVQRLEFAGGVRRETEGQASIGWPGSPRGEQTLAAGAHKEGSTEEYLAMGKKEYAERCAACHGPDARGGIGPDLTRKEYKYGKTEAAADRDDFQGPPRRHARFRQ